LPRMLAAALLGVPVLAIVVIVVLLAWEGWVHAISGFLTAVMIELGKLFGTVP
jgi:hypothetical protein